MKKFLILPTYVLMKAMRPLLPETHLLAVHNPTFAQWVDGATVLCRDFGTGLWLSLISIAFAMLIYFYADI